MLFKYAFTFVASLLFSFNVFASGSVLIDGKEIKNREQLHTILAKNLKFPAYYGKNLDALYDVLSTDFSGETIIKFKHINSLRAKLGSEYVEGLVQTIMDAAEENNRIILLLE